MNSHELAKALLVRRVNDVRIEVLIDVDEEEPRISRTELRDHVEGGYRPTYLLDSAYVVAYDPLVDVIVIKAGTVVVLSKEEMESLDT